MAINLAMLVTRRKLLFISYPLCVVALIKIFIQVKRIDKSCINFDFF